MKLKRFVMLVESTFSIHSHFPFPSIKMSLIHINRKPRKTRNVIRILVFNVCEDHRYTWTQMLYSWIFCKKSQWFNDHINISLVNDCVASILHIWNVSHDFIVLYSTDSCCSKCGHSWLLNRWRYISKHIGFMGG